MDTSILHDLDNKISSLDSSSSKFDYIIRSYNKINHLQLASYIGMTIQPQIIDSRNYFLNNNPLYRTVVERPSGIIAPKLDHPETITLAYLSQLGDLEILNSLGILLIYRSRRDLLQQVLYLLENSGFFIPLRKESSNSLTTLLTDTSDKDVLFIAYGTLYDYRLYELDELESTLQFISSDDTDDIEDVISNGVNYDRGDGVNYDRGDDRSYDSSDDRSYDSSEDKSYDSGEDRSYDSSEDRSYDSSEDRSYDSSEDRSYNSSYDISYNSSRNILIPTDNINLEYDWDTTQLNPQITTWLSTHSSPDRSISTNQASQYLQIFINWQTGQYQQLNSPPLTFPRFFHPEAPEIEFTEYELDNLANILKYYLELSNVPTFSRQIMEQILSKIKIANQLNQEVQVIDTQRLDTFRNWFPEIKLEVRNWLNEIFNLGMYMRRWKGPGYTYPHLESETQPKSSQVTKDPEPYSIDTFAKILQIEENFSTSDIFSNSDVFNFLDNYLLMK